MRFLALAIGICAAGPVAAQMFADTRLNLQFGQSDAGPGSVSGLLLSADTWLDFGRSGLQLGVVSQTSDALGDAVAVRALVWRDLRGPLRLGLSAAYASDDGVQGGTASFGLHARARTDWYGIEANLLLPDHIRDTGAFSFQFLGQQRLTRSLSVETQLYRLSTDLEDPDRYTIALGLTYAATDALTLSGQGFQTVSDDYAIKTNGTRLGLAWRVGAGSRLEAAVDWLRPDAASDRLGLTLGWQLDLGGAPDLADRFAAPILQDRLAWGAF